jgi:putative membrane protein
MKQYFFALGLGPAFALGACGGSEPVTTVDNIVATDTIIPENSIDANAATGTGINAATGAAVMTGQTFADTAGASDAYERLPASSPSRRQRARRSRISAG